MRGDTLNIRLVVGLATTLLVAGCASNDVTVGDVEPATVAELNTAVHDASSALQAKESIPIAVIYFTEEEPERAIRYEWIDFRRGGQALAVYRDLETEHTVAVSLSTGGWMNATDTQPWQPDSSPETAFERIPAVALLGRLSGEDISTTITPTITRQRASDGSELWTLREDGGATTREWIINPEGLLQFYRISNPEGLDLGASKIIYEYGVSDEDPAPIVVPEPESSLDLDELEIPPALRSLDGSE